MDFSDISRYDTDKHAYIEYYNRHFLSQREEFTSVLEIGLFRGGSLKLWRDYFPNATLAGLDIQDKSKLEHEIGDLFTYRGNQGDREHLGHIARDFQDGFDLILDDGSHKWDHQQISLGFLFPHVKAGRYYVIEDAHTSLYGLDKAKEYCTDRCNTTINMLLGMMWPNEVVSEVMTEDEKAYLIEHVEWIEMYSASGVGITCIIKKRD